VVRRREVRGEPGSDPFGQLTDTYTATGYHRHLNYDSAAQSGSDYGLPTSVVGDSIVQDDNNSYSPTLSFKYDAYGNLICYNKGNGWWAMTYDANDRQTAVGDPDDASLVVSACGKSPGIAGSTIVTTHTYFPDGSVETMQSPSEAAQGVNTSYTYDADGDTLTETRHYSYTSSSPAPIVPAQKWYDGEDRLVEVEEPYDSRRFNDYNHTPMEYFAYPWLTRYLYDFTQNHTVSFSGSSAFYAHGNLFDTQLGPQLQQTGAWTDTKGTAFDALDRPVDQYAYTTNSVLTTTSLTYDATPTTIGFLQTQCNAAGLNQCQIFDYNERGETISDSYSGSSPLPTLTYSRDADGRVGSVIWGSNGTETYAYNPDGAVTQRREPVVGGVNSRATIN
jgi:YD repeat-containing protein